jgi:hypothetical protein
MSRRKKYRVIKFMRQLRDSINSCDNYGRAQRLIMEFPMLERVEITGSWTVWVAITFKDGARHCFRAVHTIDAIKEAANFVYQDFIKYNVRIKINPQ